MIRSKTRATIFRLISFCILLCLFNIIALTFYATNLIGEQRNEISEYNTSLLRQWKPAPPIFPNYGKSGELGKAVYIPENKKQEMEQKFGKHQLNILASDQIALNRSILDNRFYECKIIKYPKLLPTTSVVIIFHNEPWSTLLRTVWSVINRSPPTLLKEIILVDDASDMLHLGQQLDDYVKDLPVPVLVLRLKTRSGVVGARLLGARHVTGSIITFLDAQCECGHGWLEPLLTRISKHRQRVVSPVIDFISAETFQYSIGYTNKYGGFDWELNFKWEDIPQREVNRRAGDVTSPILTPVIAGGIFSVDKDYFFHIGSYDEEMYIWGAENLEISIRIWQCGGKLEIVPCSHVGHVFRKTTPHVFPGGITNILARNLGRLAEVWMDEWKTFFYTVYPDVKEVNIGNVSKRLTLRNELKCNSFKWYIENIYPECTIPLDYYYVGNIRNMETKGCLDTMGGKEQENLFISICQHKNLYQVFAYTKERRIMIDKYCLIAPYRSKNVKLHKCSNTDRFQVWRYDIIKRTIRQAESGYCLQKPIMDDSTLPTLRKCDNSLGQQWIMANITMPREDSFIII